MQTLRTFSTLCGSLDTSAVLLHVFLCMFWRYFSLVTCLPDWLKLRLWWLPMDIKHIWYFLRQEWPFEFGAVKRSYCVYSVEGQIILRRSRTPRLVVNLFLMFTLHSGTQISHSHEVPACMRLSWQMWLIQLLCCPPVPDTCPNWHELHCNAW